MRSLMTSSVYAGGGLVHVKGGFSFKTRHLSKEKVPKRNYTKSD